MTATAFTAGVNVADEDRNVRAALEQELAEALQQSRDAPAQDIAAAFAALDRFGTLITAIDAVRWPAAEETRALIKRLLKLGVDPRDLYNRPFSDTVVREIYTKELGQKMPKRGPRPRTTPPGGPMPS